jgi:hypothetical protein
MRCSASSTGRRSSASRRLTGVAARCAAQAPRMARSGSHRSTGSTCSPYQARTAFSAGDMGLTSRGIRLPSSGSTCRRTGASPNVPARAAIVGRIYTARKRRIRHMRRA